MIQKTDYQKQLDDILKKIVHNLSCNTSSEKESSLTVGDNSKKQTLLLHACCAPCSSYVIEYLAQYFDITIYYYNPNIHPQKEYERRLAELTNFLPRFPEAITNKVKLITTPYDQEDFFTATNARNEPNLQTEHERGERCRRCYLFRMKKSYEYACIHNFDWFTTTLSISPYKDAEKINTIGKMLEETAHTKFLTSDFKKKNGFLRSLQLSAEYGLYRQDYCGCIYSIFTKDN
jgi:predicted adenine nucleotide alpha hydrolase (AANH) superfamily ATPase